jgi:uncharacterized protein (TIGR00369 family)
MSAPASSLALVGAELGSLFSGASFHRTLGATIAANHEGIEIRARLDSRFESIPGRLHGGVVASLLDSAGTWALIATTGEVFTTVDLRVDFLRPTPPGDVVVSGTIVSCGTSVARASSSLVDGEGRLCATATGTFVRVAPRARKGS